MSSSSTFSKENTRLKAAVIGSGFGGLAAAIRLQARGFKTTIFEKREKPGGRAYVYEEHGFVFDAGPTVITAPECIEELFELAGRKMSDYVELLPIDPFYRLHWEDGRTFDYTNDEKKLFEQIHSFTPADVEGYKKFFKYSEKVFNRGYSDLVHVPFLSFWDMVRVAPQLIRLQAYRSVYAMVSKFIQDEKLRQAFSFHSLLIGGNPFHASSIYTLIHCLERKWGVFFPKGGTHALVRALVRLFEELGGKLVTSAEIEQILTRDDRVLGLRCNGQVEDFDLVVSNADVNHTYGVLLRETKALKSKARKLSRKRFSNSLFVLYFGTNKTYSNIAHHNILFGPRYQGLLDDIFRKGKLSKDFSLYLHAPSLTDSSLAPQACQTFYCLSPVPHLGHGGIDWRTEGPLYGDRILDYLNERYLPGVKDHVVARRHFTPLDFCSELNAHLGSAFSLEPTLNQSAYFRVANRDPRIGGLYFVGAGTHPGAGVPGVINSAKATARVIFGDFLENPAFQLEPIRAAHEFSGSPAY